MARPCIYRGAEIGQPAAQQQLAKRRPAEARRDHGAGAGANRRAQSRESRSVSSVQAASHRCGLPHEGLAAAGQPRERREGDAVSALGRCTLRAAHRLRQRREPRARSIARAAEGARHARGARRGTRACRQTAHHRKRAAHARIGGCRSAGGLRSPSNSRHAEHPGSPARQRDPARCRRRRLHPRRGVLHRRRSRPDPCGQRAAVEPHDGAA